MQRFAFPLILLVVVAGMIGIFLIGNGESNSLDTTTASKTLDSPDGLPGLQTGDAPWEPNNGSSLQQRLQKMGLPRLSSEGQVLHIHQHLDVFIDGKPVPIPADIGYSKADNYISDIHTHTTDGVLHVESPKQQDFTLGQFFDVWGVKLTNDCVGKYCASGDKKVQVFANGKKVEDPRKLKLESHQQIVVAYGTDAELPNPVPDKYQFKEGE